MLRRRNRPVRPTGRPLLMERWNMDAGEDTVIDQVGVTLGSEQVSGRGARAQAARRRPAEPLFKRFAIPKEWRLKDNDSGGG